METNEYENTTIQTLWDSAKAVIRGKYIAVHAYLKKQEKTQIQNLTSHLKEQEAEQLRNLKAKRRREIIKTRAEINNIESKTNKKKKTKNNNNNPGEQINESKSWFSERINKIDNPLARLLKKETEDQNR